MANRQRVETLLDKYDTLLIILLVFITGLINYIANTPNSFLNEEWIKSLANEWLAAAIWLGAGTLILRKFLKEREQIKDEQVLGLIEDKIYEVSNNSKFILQFEERLKDVNWKPILENAKSLEVLSIYHESWLIEIEDDLIAIWDRGGKITFYMPDPTIDEVIKQSALKFDRAGILPTKEMIKKIKKKIIETENKLLNYFNASHQNTTACLEICYCPCDISYSAVKVDNSKLVLSIFEHFQAARTGPPGIVINLVESLHLKNEFEKEFTSLEQLSTSKSRKIIHTK